MKTPREKYQHDPEYNHLVNMLEQLIDQARFTPSELREACMLACINNEMRHVRENVKIDPDVASALDLLDRKFLSRRN